MAFDFTCSGCGQELKADEELVGRTVKCPSCKVPLVIEAPSAEHPEEDDSLQLADELDLSVSGRATYQADDGGEADAEADTETDNEQTECPACGVMIAAGEFECRSCRFNLQVGRRVEDFSGEEHFSGTVGFERYILKRMHHTESLASVVVWFHVGFAFLLGIVCLVLRQWWIQILIPVTVLYIAYHSLSHSNRFFYRGKSFIWWLFLRTGRLLRWRRFSGMKKRMSWKSHDPSFSDERLAAKEDLSEFNVIDLQGTGITDAGLKPFEYLPVLEFLILKKTNVTRRGVAELQLTIPDTCIWY